VHSIPALGERVPSLFRPTNTSASPGEREVERDGINKQYIAYRLFL
jgi:hypothetical protein